MRREEAHAAVDAQRSLAAVLDRELRVVGEAEDVAVSVDDHGVPPVACFALYMEAGSTGVAYQRW